MKNTLERYAEAHDFMSSRNYENINGTTYLKDNGVLTNIASGLLLTPSVPFALFYAKLGSNLPICLKNHTQP